MPEPTKEYLLLQSLADYFAHLEFYDVLVDSVFLHPDDFEVLRGSDAYDGKLWGAAVFGTDLLSACKVGTCEVVGQSTLGKTMLPVTMKFEGALSEAYLAAP